MVKIGKWNIPDELFNQYVKARINADTYISPDSDTPSHTEYERIMRWNLSVQIMMKLHREICYVLGIEYSEDITDIFYKLFMDEVNKQSKLKG